MAIVKLLRYPDLVTAGVVANRVTLGRLIKNQQFPPVGYWVRILARGLKPRSSNGSHRGRSCARLM
jgi:hypothetical protein